MSVMHEISLRMIQKNRLRTRITVLNIFLSSVFLTVVTLFGLSLVDYMKAETIKRSGNHHIFLAQISAEEESAIDTDARVQDISKMVTYGYGLLETGNPYKPYFLVCGAQEAFLDNTVHLLEGRYPQNEKEILIQRQSDEWGAPKYAIGDVLRLPMGLRMQGEQTLWQSDSVGINMDGSQTEHFEPTGTERNFTVVGVCETISYPLEDLYAPGSIAFTIIDDDLPSYGISLKLILKNPRKQLAAFLSDYRLPERADVNYEVLEYEGIFDVSQPEATTERLTALIFMIGFVFLLLAIAIVGLIGNTFSIFFSDRQHEYGLLNSMGASRKQLRSAVIFEAVCMALAGIPVGVAAGCGIVYGTLTMGRGKLMQLMETDIPVKLVAPPAILVGIGMTLLALVLLSVMGTAEKVSHIQAMDAIRRTSDFDTGNRVERKLQRGSLHTHMRAEWALARSYFIRRRKLYRAVVIPLAVCIFLIIAADCAVRNIYEQMQIDRQFYGRSYDITINLTEGVLYDDLLKDVQSIDGVTEAMYCSNLEDQYWKMEEELLSEEFLQWRKEEQTSSGDFQPWIGEAGASSLWISCRYVDNDTFKALAERYHLTERIDSLETCGGILFNRPFLHRWNNGIEESAQISMFRMQPDALHVLQRNGIDNEILQTLPILGMTEDFPEEVLSSSNGGITILYPYAQIKETFGPLLQVNTITGEHTKAELQTLLEKHGQSYFSFNCSFEERQWAQRRIKTMLLLTYGLTGMLLLVAAANVFHVISTGILVRRREFAMLRSVGMSIQQMRRMLRYECFSYIKRAIQLSAIPCILLILGMNWNVRALHTVSKIIPYRGIFGALVGLTLFAVISTLYSIHLLGKEELMETMRTEYL